MNLLNRNILQDWIEDDRGAGVFLWDASAARGSDDPVEQAVAQRTVQLAQERTTAFLLLSILLVPVVLVIAVLLPLPPIAIAALPILSLLLLIAWSVRRTRQITRPAIRITLLSECRCASCAYDLLASPPEADGCTVCPECNAAWRITPEMRSGRSARDRLATVPIRDPEEIASDRASREWLHKVMIAINWRPRYTSRDAKGRMVDLLDVGLFGKRPARWEDVPQEERGELWWELYLIGWGWRLTALLLVLPLLLFLAWRHAWGLGPGGLGGSPMRLVMAFFYGVYLPLVVLGGVLNPGPGRRKTIVRRMLRRGHCPSCAARLPTPPEGERIVTCGACAAAWDTKPETLKPGFARQARTAADDAWFNPQPVKSDARRAE